MLKMWGVCKGGRGEGEGKWNRVRFEGRIIKSKVS